MRTHHPLFNFFWGSALLLLGTVATYISYNSAADNQNHFTFWYGALVIGLVRIIISLIQLADSGGAVKGPKKITTVMTLPNSYYSQYTHTPTTDAARPVRIKTSNGNGGNTALLLSLCAGAVVMVALAGGAVYNMFTDQNPIATVTQALGMNKITPPDDAHTNTAVLDAARPQYITAGSTATSMPLSMGMTGWHDAGNGIAVQYESAGACVKKKVVSVSITPSTTMTAQPG